MGPSFRAEGPRGCGYRKEGGLYLMGGRLSEPCGRLPFELKACPTCGGGWRQSRSWKWIEPAKLVAEAPPCRISGGGLCAGCPMGEAAPARGGLMWVGTRHYPTPGDFAREAAVHGVSKRVAAVPKGVEVGTVCYLAHPKAISEPCPADHERPAALFGRDHEGCEECDGSGHVYKPGLFASFAVSGIEKVVKRDISGDECDRLRKRGVEPVVIEERPSWPAEESGAA